MSGNSWQQPVSGEFGRGTMKKHYALLVDVDPDVAVTDVPCDEHVSKGCRTVLLHIDARSTGASYSVQFYDDIGATVADLWGHAQTNSANARWHGQLIVGLDADRKFYYQAAHANVNLLVVEMVVYWE